tara:strand:+ start:153 stop:467 length:315 start_codon:yes stop_codon:yes gene_type:complete
MDINELKYIIAAKGEITESDSLKSEIFNEAFKHASGWYKQLTPRGIHKSKSKRALYKKAYNYTYERMEKPSGFIPSFVWWWIARTVIRWIVRKIIEHIIDTHWK